MSPRHEDVVFERYAIFFVAVTPRPLASVAERRMPPPRRFDADAISFAFAAAAAARQQARQRRTRCGAAF
jgi:hypothetical protein